MIHLVLLERDHPPFGGGVVRASGADHPPPDMDRLDGLEVFDLGCRFQDLGPDLEAAVELDRVFPGKYRKL